MSRTPKRLGHYEEEQQAPPITKNPKPNYIEMDQLTGIRQEHNRTVAPTHFEGQSEIYQSYNVVHHINTGVKPQLEDLPHK